MYQVLIVDDEEIIKIGLRSIINWEQYGFNIVGTAENGQQALDTAKKIRPDVIITDLYMPIMDGFELIERLKKNGLECEIIVLSNYGDIENVKKAIKMGAEDYILKVSYDQKKFAVLLESLSEKLSRKKQVGKIKAQNEPKEEISLSQMKEYLLGTGALPSIQLNHKYQLYILSLPKHIVLLEDSQYADVTKKIKIVTLETLNAYDQQYVIPINRKQYVIIIDSADQKFAKENAIHIKLQKALAIYLMVNSVIVYENNIQGLNQLKECFQEGMKKSEIGFFDGGCYCIKEVVFSSISQLVSMPQVMNHFKKFLSNPDIERFDYEITNVLKNFASNHVNPKEIKEFMSILVSNTRIYFYGIYHLDILDEYSQLVIAADSMQELYAVTKQWVWDLGVILKKADVGKYNYKTIEKIERYIEQNISEKLRLNEIASIFNFHPNYLSTYFKEQKGISLISYINNMKMEYAGKLLLENRYRVKEVALMVGIEDPFYFNKLFKNHFGCAPSQYANKD